VSATGTFFGIQLAVQSPPGDPWRGKVCDIVRQHQRDLAVVDKRVLYGALANLLVEAAPRWTLGFWDFIAGGQSEFDDWVRGLEDDARERWQPDASGAPMDQALVSVVVLLEPGGNAARIAGDRCDIPESDWRTRDTYVHLVETLPMLSFPTVRGDGVYVTPGGPDLAFSRRELEGEGYEYLLAME
jgi:hypothetical protein